MVDLATVRASFRAEATQGVVATGRARLPYWSWGDGPPLVCVHGISDIGLSFLLPAHQLRDSYRVIAYTQANGQDGADLAQYTHANLVDDLLALADHLALNRTALFGVSFGTTVALAALHRAPERFPRAILQAGVAYRPLYPHERLGAWLTRYLPGTMAYMPFRSVVARFLESRNFDGLPHEVWRCYLDTWGQDPVAAFACRLMLLHKLDLRPLLPKIRQPILRILGDRDPIVSRPLEALLDALPNARRVELKACGHLPCYTHPEQLVAAIRAFLPL
jgi:pimeloyl-ACP methyl ester carboxylesterase